MCENASPRKKHDLHPPPRIKSLYNVLTKTSSDKLPNLAILTENEFLFSYKDRLSVSEFMTGHGPVSGLRPMRGDVMDFFAQLEFIVNKIFVTHLVNSKNEVRKFEQLLDSIDFFLKIRLLNEWSLIDNRAKERLICLKEVRNGLLQSRRIILNGLGQKWGKKARRQDRLLGAAGGNRIASYTPE